MIMNELNILRKISQGHRYILSLVDYFQSINNCKLLFNRTIIMILNN
jgi:hypothetical protein